MRIISNYTSIPNFQRCSCMDRQTTYLKTLADINRERMLQELAEYGQRQGQDEAADVEQKREKILEPLDKQEGVNEGVNKKVSEVKDVLPEQIKKLNKPEYNVEDSLSKRTAEYLAMFTLTTQNNSNNDIREFYTDDKTAEPLIAKHDTPCQKKAREIREEFQKLKEVNDPVAALITANKMKKFTQISEYVNKKENNNFIEGIKDTFSTIIRNADLDKYEPPIKAMILEMVQKIESSTSVDFGLDTKIRKLVDMINSKKLKLGFIPPVQVKEFIKK